MYNNNNYVYLITVRLLSFENTGFMAKYTQNNPSNEHCILNVLKLIKIINRGMF